MVVYYPVWPDLSQSLNMSLVVQNIIRDILLIRLSAHDTIQVEIGNILERNGQTASLEHLVPSYLPSNNHRGGYIDIVSTGPIRMGIEVDHSTPRTKSILKLNHFNGDLSMIVLKGQSASHSHKVEETKKRCLMFKTPYVVIELNERRIMLASNELSSPN